MQEGQQPIIKDAVYKRSALDHLGSERTEQAYLNIYGAITDRFGGMTHPELIEACYGIPNATIRGSVAEKIAKLSTQRGMTDDRARDETLKYLIQRTHENAMIVVGRRVYSPTEGGAKPVQDIAYDKLHRKAKLLVQPAAGLTFEEITARQHAALTTLSGNTTTPIYETTQSREMQGKMREAGHHEAAAIP